MTANDKTGRSAPIGVISDTHGYLHPAVVDVFRPVGRIIHAGDIGDPVILQTLGRIAPVTAVRGNMDAGSWASGLAATEIVEVESLRLCVLHDRDRLDIDPWTAGINLVISGHTHRPEIKTKDGVQFINPGSASHPRYRTPPTVVLLHVVDGDFSARIVALNPQTK